MTGPERELEADSSSTPVSVPSDSIAQGSGSSLTVKRGVYHVPNRSAVRAIESQPGSHTQVSSRSEATVDYGVKGYDHGAASSETAPGCFQETQILSPSEVRKRTLQALHRAEQRRKQLREEEARYLSDTDS
jgi:hypothetical protein